MPSYLPGLAEGHDITSPSSSLFLSRAPSLQAVGERTCGARENENPVAEAERARFGFAINERSLGHG